MKSVVVTVMFLLPSLAHAIGDCEGEGARLQPAGYSLAGKALVFTGTVEYCAQAKGGAKKLSVPVKVVMGLGGGVRGRYVLPEKGKATAAELSSAETHLGGAPKGPAEWAKEEKALGKLETAGLFNETKTKLTSPNGACTVEIPTTKPARGSDGFDKTKLTVLVKAGEAKLLSRGLGWTTPNGPLGAVIFDAETGALTVAWVVTVCNGGPPPGTFGPDDGGDCYEHDKPSVLTFSGAKVKKDLAPCFAAGK